MATAQLSAAAFVEAVKACGLLDPGRLREVMGDADQPGSDPHRLASQLVQAGYLTPYQTNRILAGRGPELLLGHYVLLERLGEGGMAQVFKARHRMINRVVALKLIHPDHLKNSQALTRFRREVRAVAQLSHPNIVAALDADEVNGTSFFVMDYVDGLDLGRLVKQSGPLPVAQACDFIRQPALGLAHAHDKGLIHRDIKPSNLIVTTRPSADGGAGAHPWGLVKVLDLGLARSRVPVETEESAAVTQAGLVIGTPDFLAPEQATDAQRADARADIYSLGATAYYLLTGRVPFPGGSTIDKVIRHRLEEAPPLRQLRPEVPEELCELVHLMLAKKPEDRPQTSADVASAFEAWCKDGGEMTPVLPSDARPFCESISETPRPRPTAVDYRLKADRRRWNATVAAGAACLLASLTVLVFLLGRSGKTPASRADAADDPLRPFLAQAAKPDCDFSQLRSELIAFRALHHGTPLAKRATDLLLKIPSSFDGLAASRIAPDRRFPLRGAELVSLVGDGRLRHWDKAYAVACDPKGQLLVSGGEDRQVIVWDAATGKRRHSFEGHTGPVRSVAASKNGKWIASAGHDHTVRLWDLSGRREIASLKHPAPVIAVAFSPDDKQMAAVTSTPHGAPGGSLHLWDVALRKRTAVLGGHRGTIHTVAYSPDGRFIATAGDDQVIRLWEGGKELAALNGHHGPVLALAFVRDGNTLVSGGTDKTLRIWDVGGRKERHGARNHPHPVCTVVAFSGGTLVAAGSSDGSIKLWDAANGQDRGTLQGHAGTVSALAAFPDGGKLVSAGHDHSIRIWDIAGQRQCTPGELEPIRVMALTSDDRTLATGHLGGKIRLRNPANHHERGVLEGHRDYVSALAFSPDGQRLASGGGDNQSIVWDVATGKSRLRLEGHQAPVTAAVFSPDGRRLLTGSLDRTARCWDTASGREIDTFSGHRDAVCTVAISPDGRTVATGSFDRTIKVWEAATAKERFGRHEFHGESLAFAADGKALAGGSEHGTVRLWSVPPNPAAEHRTLPGFRLIWPRATAVSLDGSLLAVAGSDGQCVIWNLTSNREIHRLQYPGIVRGLAFSSDGRHLVSANGNGTVAVVRLTARSAAARDPVSTQSFAKQRR